jgi:hypothetical protein
MAVLPSPLQPKEDTSFENLKGSDMVTVEFSLEKDILIELGIIAPDGEMNSTENSDPEADGIEVTDDIEQVEKEIARKNGRKILSTLLESKSTFEEPKIIREINKEKTIKLESMPDTPSRLSSSGLHIRFAKSFRLALVSRHIADIRQVIENRDIDQFDAMKEALQQAILIATGEGFANELAILKHLESKITSREDETA